MNSTEIRDKPQQKKTSYSDLEATCLSHMASNGIPYQGPLEETKPGKYHRFSIDNKKNQTDEFYSCSKWEFKGNLYLTCFYGTWDGGLKEYTYSSFENDMRLSEEDYKKFKSNEERRRREHVEQQKKDAERRLNQAKTNWEKAKDQPFHNDHTAYLNKKQVKAIGLKYSIDFEENHVLIVPLHNLKDEIQAIQHIKANGEKRIYGLKKGNFHVLGQIKENSAIFCAEGYSTAYSVHEATGAPVVVAFDCGNIDSVIGNLRTKYPNNPITIAADDDRGTKENPGRTHAENAAKKHKCAVILPTFPEDFTFPGGALPTDFNDLHVHFGIDVVKNQLNNSSFSTTYVQDELKKLSYSLLEKEEPCASFSQENMPKLLADYVSSICETTNAHPIMITSSVLATVSAFMQKKVFLPEGEYFQTLYSNLWLLNVTKSGQFKSTAMNKGAKLAWERSKIATEAIKSIEAKLRVNIDKSKTKALEEEKLTASLNDVVLPNKITTEALLEHLAQGHSGVIFTSEFGAWLQNLEKSHNNDLKAILTDLFDVPQSYRYKTRTQGDSILEKPFFSICGVSTMSWLRANLKPDDVSSGFFARYLLFTPPYQDEIPPALPKLILPSNRNSELKVKATLENMEDLYSYKLAPSAKKEFESLHNSLYKMTKSYSDKCQEILEPYLKRWSPYILKLSMIMRPFEDPFSKEISDTSINAAMAILLPAIKSTAQLFETELGESDHQRKCRLLYEWICTRIMNKKTTSWAAIMGSKLFEGGSTMYEYPLKTLIESGQIREILKSNKKDCVYVPTNQRVE